MSSILDDEEYKKALSLADAVAKEQYEEEASSIAKIQDGILQIVQKEKPYDVFISYKETDEFDSRTEDSVLAQEIYDKLQEEGYRVFLSRVSLSSVVGHEYEPYIYSALYTAKAMILVACNPDYVNAVWVKNEWQRYLFMMQKEKGKILIPCYRGVDPYDLPKELRRLQGIDASKLGWIQDLSLGLKKVIKKEKEVVQGKTVIAANSLDGMADQMIQRGFDFLKKGDVGQVKKLFEESLSYADKALAHMGFLCAELGKQDLEGLASLHKDIGDEPRYATALKIASNEEKKEIEGIRESILKNIAADKAAIEKEKRDRYDYAISLKNNGEYLEAAARFSELSEFLDAREQQGECQRLQALEERKKRLEKYLFEVKRICRYKKPTLEELENALSMARVLKEENYGEGVDGYLAYLSKKISAKRKIKVISIVSLLSALFLAIFIPVMTVNVFIPLGRQNEAIAAIEAKDYGKANNLLKENGDFGESEKLKTMVEVGRDLEKSSYRFALMDISQIGGSYFVSLDYKGGMGEATPSFGTDYTVTNKATKNGYTFVKWEVDDYSLDARNYSVFVTLGAGYGVNTYKITYNLNGGTNDPSNPSTYTVEDATITLKEPAKDGYAFLGWSTGSKIITSIETGSFGDLTLTAQWRAEKQNMSVVSSDSSKGTVSFSGTVYTDETIVVTASPKKDFAFMGWYSEGSLVSRENPYTFQMPAGDHSLAARFGTRKESLGVDPVIDLENKTVTYGLYPQKRVSNSATLSSLNALTSVESNGWYLLDGCYYAKKEASPYNSGYTFDDGTTIVSGTAYWFKCEPIEWRILSSSEGEYSLVSTVLLDAHRYNEYYSGTKNGCYANNYERSEIRGWLNGDFYDSAFSLGDSLIQTTTVDNSASTTSSSSNSYACSDTEDKVYLLSYKDYANAAYFAAPASRQSKTTDWARANGAYCSTSSSYLHNGWYWTRSPFSSYSGRAWNVYYDGDLNHSYVDGSYCSVRPSLRIKVAQ